MFLRATQIHPIRLIAQLAQQLAYSNNLEEQDILDSTFLSDTIFFLKSKYNY